MQNNSDGHLQVKASILKKLACMIGVVVLICLIAVYTGNDIFIYFESGDPSISKGTPDKGELINGKRLPSRGENYRAYSNLGALLGRNSVNDKVRDVVIDAYQSMYIKHPEKRFIYGETSWPSGGSFRPHKSHQNGLSVDFMVPVIDAKGKSVGLPCSLLNKFCYNIEFDDTGKTKDFRIDYETMAAHLLELDVAAKKHNIRIRRVIFDPELQPFLFKAEQGNKVRSALQFSKKRSWVRHDEHYHVDFAVD